MSNHRHVGRPAEDEVQPGPSATADDTTAADMGLVGGTGADKGQGTAWPTGTALDEPHLSHPGASSGRDHV